MLVLFISTDSFVQQEPFDLLDFFEKRRVRNITPIITPHITIQPTKGRRKGKTASVVTGFTVNE